jgi:hypothetical protein
MGRIKALDWLTCLYASIVGGLFDVIDGIGRRSNAHPFWCYADAEPRANVGATLLQWQSRNPAFDRVERLRPFFLLRQKIKPAFAPKLRSTSGTLKAVNSPAWKEMRRPGILAGSPSPVGAKLRQLRAHRRPLGGMEKVKMMIRLRPRARSRLT